MIDAHTLLQKLEAGDELAFRQVFETYYRRLCVYAERFVIHQEEAEDIVGEAFLQLWKGKRTFAQLEHLKASLYVAVKNLGLNHRHSLIKSMERNYRYTGNHMQEQTDYLLEITRVEALNELYDAVKSLPERARQIVLETHLPKPYRAGTFATEILVKNQQGDEQALRVPITDSVTKIAAIGLVDGLKYRTLFLPDTLAIDTFYTEFTTYSFTEDVADSSL